MLVTSIEQINRLQYTVTLDHEIQLVLYKGDLTRFGIEEGNSITTEKYHIIVEKVILKRAKAKLLQLIKISDKSENELRLKLRQKNYSIDVIDRAIEYAKGYGYIDDRRFVTHIINARISRKSKREIVAYLRGKGVSAELIEEGFQDTKTDEVEVVRKLLHKKLSTNETISNEKSCKLYGYLLRKGFSAATVMKCLHEVGLKYNETEDLDIFI
ncbi:MAG: RecX family transcriptional regulator [Clostridiales bacterium]|jgi:regulatory protein|nr:RecX family transcriptional regulator [Clostridiales bacterium]